MININNRYRIQNIIKVTVDFGYNALEETEEFCPLQPSVHLIRNAMVFKYQRK